jgi:hypothetical protein
MTPKDMLWAFATSRFGLPLVSFALALIGMLLLGEK